MSAALKHPMIGPHTVAEWLAMDNPADGSRLELILGHLLMTPAPSGPHQRATSRLTRWLEDVLEADEGHDLYVVPAVNVRISTGWRTAVIPDIAVLNCEPADVIFDAENLVLAVEVWSPGNPRDERETKLAGYAGAKVPFVWTVDQGNSLHGLTLTAFRLQDGQYTLENKIQADGPATVTAAPVPITLDLTRLFR
ncbi:Uma2 family endonuclease [Actinocrispum sp. NPDC049592]|uniref:Uma2 family endonuclease n=1 Tax=Actinocrispum sp. NPDC049592 TaxID=3154835 RepID=UPI003414E8D0